MLCYLLKYNPKNKRTAGWYCLQCINYMYSSSQEEVDEDDEKLLEAFLSKGSSRQQTLADVIAQKIKENDASVSVTGEDTISVVSL